MTGSRISQAPPAKYLKLTKNLMDNGEEERLAGGGEDPEVLLPSRVPFEPPKKWWEWGFYSAVFHRAATPTPRRKSCRPWTTSASSAARRW